MERFLLTGYDVEDLLGFGGFGEVWLGRERATGDAVALKRLHVGGGAWVGETNNRLRREAALLATVQHEHVVRLRSVVPTDEGLVLVLDYAEGGSLASLLVARGSLTPGEVVTIGAPLAQALADVHARGLLHSDVTPANIVFDRHGKPLLADLGVASLVGERDAPVGATPGYADPSLAAGGGAATAAADVHGLAAVCFTALAGVTPYRDAQSDGRFAGGPASAAALGPLVPSAPAALIAAIEAALHPDPRARPDAAGFGRALFAACTPEVVRLVQPELPVAPEPTHEIRPRHDQRDPQPAPTQVPRAAASGRGRHRWSARRRAVMRRFVATAGAVGLLATAAAAGIAWASHDRIAVANQPASTVAATAAAAAAAAAAPSLVPPASAAPAAAAAGSTTDWSAVVTELDSARDRAFVDGDSGELERAYVADSPALATERLTLATLVAAGVHARGLKLRLVSVSVVEQRPGQVTLAVRDTLAPYDVVGSDGAVESRPGRAERGWTMVLHDASTTAGAKGWRIATITAD